MEGIPWSRWARACTCWIEARRVYPPLLTLAAAAVVLVLAVSGIGVYYEVELHRVTVELRGIRGHALPAVNLLADGRTVLRRLDAAIDAAFALDSLPAEPLAPWRADVEAARKGLNHHVEAYLALPKGNRLPTRGDLAAQLRELDGALAGLFAAVGEKDWARIRLVRRDWRRASDRLDASLARLLEAHGAVLTGHVAQIEALWAQATAGAMGLSAIDFVLILFVTWAVAEVMRRQRIRDREHEAEMDMFAHRVAHDILSPLQAVQLAAETVTGSEDPRVRKMAAHCNSAVRRSREVVDALLEFARSGAKPAPGERCEIEPLLSGLMGELRPQAQAAGIDLQLDCTAPGGAACPPGVLAVIVTNLVRNAIKYIGDAAERRVVVRAAAGTRTLRLAVDDTGPGLPPAFAARAFEPYVRGPGATGPGLGLGLATVRRLATACGGAAGVRPRPGGGSTFWVELPRV